MSPSYLFFAKEHSMLIVSYFPCRSSLHDINIKRNCCVLILNPRQNRNTW